MLDGAPGRTAKISGKEYLFFSGYAYLGVQQVPEFIALVKEGTDKYGWLHPSSRISNTRLALFEECEALLSYITGCESTVLLPSGFTAGQLATQKWAGSITNLQPSHPAIQTPNPAEPTGVYAVDAVNVLTAAITDFYKVNSLPGLQTLIIDDSHGIGLIGNNGSGAGSLFKRHNNVEYIFTYSLSKAIGINGGAISCPATMAGWFRSQPVYTASTGPSPALLYAILKGQHIYQAQREKLRQNVLYFMQLAQNIPGIAYHPSLPIFVFLQGVDEQALLNNNIIISSFAYPNPAGKKIQRVVLNALHTKTDLGFLAQQLVMDTKL